MIANRPLACCIQYRHPRDSSSSTSGGHRQAQMIARRLLASFIQYQPLRCFSSSMSGGRRQTDAIASLLLADAYNIIIYATHHQRAEVIGRLT